MPLNLELKIKMDSHKTLRELLVKIGAENMGILNQKDIYYRVKSGRLKLRIENDHAELIKYDREESGKARWSDYELIKFCGNNPEKFFSNIFEVEAVVQKKRELWIYDNTRIHLDSVRNLGSFIELETLVLNGKKNARERFNNLISTLRLDMKAQILSSYKNLIMNKKRKGKHNS